MCCECGLNLWYARHCLVCECEVAEDKKPMPVVKDARVESLWAMLLWTVVIAVAVCVPTILIVRGCR